MEWGAFQTWLIPASIGALGIIVWWRFNRLDDNLNDLRTMVTDELRAMDVRLTKIEAHMWPERR